MRDELLEREAASWSALEVAVAKVPAERLAEPGAVPGWSVADLVWHCTKWADYSGGNLEAMAAGTFVPDDHDDAYFDGLNAAFAEESKAMSWDAIVTGAAAARERVRAALAALPEVTDQAAEDFGSETFEHYEEHAAEIAVFAEGS